MNLREKINADFITAMKEKNQHAKSALSSVKAEITKAEKADQSWEATDDNVIKIVNKSIKSREDSIKIFRSGNRPELADIEIEEKVVLEKYMPAKMTEQEVTDALTEIMQGFAGVITNPQALQGKTIGEFNKRYNGRSDIGTIRMILANLVNS